jgi:hypothetical protein
VYTRRSTPSRSSRPFSPNPDVTTPIDPTSDDECAKISSAAQASQYPPEAATSSQNAMTGTFLRSASSRIRSPTSADCVGAPPGELIASATAASRSLSKAFVRACSTVLMLMAPLASGDGVGVITPCSFTTATTGLAGPRLIGRRAVSFSVTLMRQTLRSPGRLGRLAGLGLGLLAELR